MTHKLCEAHAQKLVKKSAIKTLRWVRKCSECMSRIQQKKLCQKHDDLYNVWQEKQIDNILSKCGDCR